MNKAFSLVELSIVLVILGLLTGGILTGQNLIRAAEIRGITTSMQGYQTAAYSFRDKYLSLPGDLKNASDFWSDAVNGDGDAQLEPATADGGDGEMFGFWEQLALAGLVEGSYSGASGDGGTGLKDAVIGTNVPAGKISSSGWSILYIGTIASGDTNYFAGNYGNSFVYGTKIAADITAGAVIRPEEAWNVDIKIDDSQPETGKIRALENLSAADATGCSNTATGNYSVTNTNIECSLVFLGL